LTYAIPPNPTKPTLIGSPTVGQTLKLTHATVQNPPVWHYDDWFRCDNPGVTCTIHPISRSTSSYTLVAAAAGEYIDARESFGFGFDIEGFIAGDRLVSNIVGPIMTRTVVVPPATVSKLKLSPKKFSLAGRKLNGKCVTPTKKNARKPRCERPIQLKVSYTLDRAATVTFTLKRQARGRKVEGKCVKPAKNNQGHTKCFRLVTVSGKIVKTGKLGANTFTFNGKLGGHKLGPGTYQLTATPTRGKPQTVTFTITS
jgi:hypothetical protein